MLESKGYTRYALVGFLAMFTGAFARQAVQFALFVALARLLPPDCFGTLAILFAVLAVAQVISELGLSVAVVQRQELTRGARDSAFWLTIAWSVSMALLLGALSGPLSVFYESKVLRDLLRVASLVLLLRGVLSFFRALLLRDLRYRALSTAELCGVVVGAALTALLAVLRRDVFSIVWGELLGLGLTVTIAALLTGYRPRSLGSVREMRELAGYGVWVALARTAEQASGQFDKFILGRCVAPSALGVYYAAHRLATLLPSLTTSIVDQVMLPVFSRIQHNPAALERGYWRALRLSAMVVLPIAVLIGVFADRIVLGVLGPPWAAAIPLTRILAVVGAIQAMGGGIFSSVVYASGRPRAMVCVTTFRVVALPLCLVVGCLHSGVTGAAWGAVVFAFLGRLFNQGVLRYVLGFDYFRFFSELARPLMAFSGTLLAALAMARHVPLHDHHGTLLVALALQWMAVVLVHVVLCICILPEECRMLWDRGLGPRRHGQLVEGAQP